MKDTEASAVFIKKKQVGRALIFILMFVILAASTACGGKNGANPDQLSESTAGSQSDVQATTAEAPETAAAEQTLAAADTKATVDSLIGSWIDINDNSRTVTITKAEARYLYEDNDGKYPATFVDGVLKVKVSDSDTDTADVYIDSNTGHMLTVYQGGESEFKKK